MTSFRLLPLSGLLLLTALLIGCGGTAPVRNVTGSSVITAATRPVSTAEVRDAIVQAGQGLGWEMRPIASGQIIGTLFVRTHMAQVDIRYNRENYDIYYRNSSNLKYDGEQIHNRYNAWVQNLDTAIKQRLAAKI